MRNIPVFSGLVFLTLFHCLPKTFATTTATDTLVFSTALGNAVLPDSNQIYLGEGNPNASSCTVHVMMTQTVDNPCLAGEVVYSVQYYPLNGASAIDLVTDAVLHVNPLVPTFHLSLDTRSTDLAPDDPISINGIPYTNAFCDRGDSYHRVVWTVALNCDSVYTFDHLIRVVDGQAPTIQCVGLSSIVMPSSGSVTLYASDFIASGVDDCALESSLKYSFSEEVYEPSATIDCDVIMCNGSPTFNLSIWIADEGVDLNCDGLIGWNERNRNACSTLFVIDDNENACGDLIGFIGGQILTEELNPVSDVDVFLKRGEDVIAHDKTGPSGIYNFIYNCPLLPMDDLWIECEKLSNPKNGVSTLDLVKLQKHLLGTSLITSPYKIIAGDVNSSQSISPLDLVDIRKLILMIVNEFPKSPSWRFVPQGFGFQDPVHPWPFPDTLQASYTLSNNFIGVKIGDVNGNVIPVTGEQILTRNAHDPVQLMITDREVREGETIDVPVRCNNTQDMQGLQFTMEFDGVQFQEMSSSRIPVEDEFLAVRENAMAMSYASVVPSGSGALFVLRVKCGRDGMLSELIHMSSSIVEPEVYVDDESDISVVPLRLSFADPGSGILYQNVPNPFVDFTQISFDLPASTLVQFDVFTQDGKLVLSNSEVYDAGLHSISIYGKDLPGPGAYYYRITSDGSVAVRKFVYLENK